MGRIPWLRRLVALNSLGLLQTELCEALLARGLEEADLRGAGLPADSLAHTYREHFLNASMGNDAAFFLTLQRRYLVRDRLQAAAMKDALSFLLLGLFTPRLAFGLCSCHLLLRLLLELSPDPRLVDLADRVDLGRATRLLLLAYPVRYFI